MTTKRLIIIALMILSCVNCLAQNQDASALFQKANDAYTGKDYPLATELYEQIVAQGFSAPELNYNLGNAYYKQGNYTRAILNYERAIKQDDTFEDAKNNLKLANTHLQDNLKDIPATNFAAITEMLGKGVGMSGWATFSLLFLGLGLALLLTYFFSERLNLRKLSFSFGFVCIVLSLISLAMGFYTQNINDSTSEAIITDVVVTAKSSPDESGTDVLRIHEGLKVSIKDKSLDWVEIRLSDGRVGWIKASALEII
ncbi:MAG: tetratricopeptide repeat protein [Bacteroidales bacterium]|nr:tetratricopeptide repeat protein [Bacteroidales bacterium]